MGRTNLLKINLDFLRSLQYLCISKMIGFDMKRKDRLISVKIPLYLYEIIKGISRDSHVPVQKLTEIELRKSPRIKRILNSIE